MLVNLGQGTEVSGLAERCVAHLAGRDGVQVAVLSSTIAAGLDVPDGVVHLEATYPVSRYYRAIDAAVSAAGYNAYHELIRLGVPSLYAPMRRRTDDQHARARYAERVGAGLELKGSGVEARLEELLDPACRAGMRARLAELRPANGAGEAARWLEELARAGPRAPRAPVSRWRSYARSPLSSARKAAPFVARMPLEWAAIVKQTIQRPAPRTVVVAVDVRPGGIEEIVADALSRTPDPPERILLITDSLELAALRAAGVGHEHVPARGEPQAELAGSSYEDFLAGRLRLIMAERRRPERVLAVGEAAEAALASGTLSR